MNKRTFSTYSPQSSGPQFVAAARARSLFRVFANLRLRVKLILSFMAVVITSAAATTLVTDGVVRNELMQQVGQDLRSRAVSVANEIGGELIRNRDLLQTIATARLTRDAVKAANVSNSAVLAEIQRLDQQWLAADAAGNDYDPLVTKVLSNDIAVELRKFRDNFPQNVEVFVTDRNGSSIASTNRTSDYYQADEGWWQAAYNNGQGAVYIGQPEYDESSKTYSINMAVPVYADDGQTVAGVVRTTLDASALKAVLGRADFGRSGEADLRVAQNTAINKDAESAPEEIDPDLVSHLATVADSYGEFEYEGQSSLVSQVPMTARDPGDAAIFDQLGWFVYIHQDVAEALEPVDSATRATLLVALGALLVAGLAAVGIAQLIAGPIVRLTAVAEKVRAGDLSAQASVETGDEVGTLATTFNSMTAQLKDTLAGLEQRVTERTRALATVAEVSTATSTILEVDQLLQEVTDLSKERFNLYHSHIYLLDDAGTNLVLAAGAGEPGRQMMAKGLSIPLDREQSLVARAARERKGVTVNDVTQAPDFLPNPLLPDTRSELAVPMIVGNNVLGVFDVQSDQIGRFTDSDINIQTTLAAQVAASIQNVRRFESTQKIAADLGAVANVGIATSTITEAGHLLQEVVNLTQKSFNLYHAHIYLLNKAEDTLELAAGAGEVGRKMVAEGRQIPLASEQSLVARAAREGKGVTVNDVTQAPDFLPNPLLPETRSEMAVPMLAGGKVIGVLDVQSEAVNRFSETDISIQTTLASQVAAALQNARTFSLARRQAERETTLNLITHKIQGATTVEAALQITARELGHALGMKQTLVSLEPIIPAGERKADL